MMTFLIVLALVAIFATLLRPAFMAALAANREVNLYTDRELRAFPLKAAAHPYKGSFIGLDASTGYSRALVAGDQFQGIAYEEMDNTSGASGALSVRAYTDRDFQHALANAVITDVGKMVYALDDNTLTFSSAGTSLVGTMIGFVSAGIIVVRPKITLDTRSQRIVNKTQADTPVTLYAQDSGKIYKNLGATGQCTFALPAAPPAGLVFEFVTVAAQEIRVDPGANDAFFIAGAKQTDGKYITFDDEAEHVKIVSDENGDWIVINNAGTISVEA